jgi:hypothetical protein
MYRHLVGLSPARRHGGAPLRYGNTDLQESEGLAIGWARMIGALVTRSL